ncbi:unnamed protein product [Effrenium voratum]|nr:unnamed protein product [Effrenium voratum]
MGQRVHYLSSVSRTGSAHNNDDNNHHDNNHHDDYNYGDHNHGDNHHPHYNDNYQHKHDNYNNHDYNDYKHKHVDQHKHEHQHVDHNYHNHHDQYKYVDHDNDHNNYNYHNNDYNDDDHYHATEITFIGGDPGDKVKFEVDCDSLTDDNFTILRLGQKSGWSRSWFDSQGEGFLLCYKRGHEAVHGEHHLTLDVKGPTGTDHISAMSPTLVKRDEAADIELDGPAKTAGRVCFSPDCSLCPQLYDGEYPAVQIPGTVTFLKEANKLHQVAPDKDDNEYKICYQEDFSCEWVEQSGGLKLRFDPHVKSLDQSCIAANRDATIRFTGAWKGDRVEFAESCNDMTEPDEVLNGEGKRAMWYAGEALDGVKLCYKPDASDAVPGYVATVAEQENILLYIKKVTLKNVITSFSPKTVAGNTENTMYFWGKWQVFEGQPQAGGKICFAQEVTGCTPCFSGVRPAFDITVTDEVVPGPLGKISYRPDGVSHDLNEIVCYQAPNSCQWVRQTDKVLEVINGEVPPATAPNTVSSIWPAAVNINVMTSLTFKGAAPGDKAIFVSAEGGANCDNVRPDKEVGFGEGLFSFSKLGVYHLCYRATGAHDSVAQMGFNLTVRSPGVSKDMIRPFEEKGGISDCSALQMVPHCSMMNQDLCESSYVIYRGTGYKCSWNKEIWPPACDLDKAKAPQSDICQPSKCPGSPSLCW